MEISLSHTKSGASQVSKPSRYDLVRNNLIVDRKAGSKVFWSLKMQLLSDPRSHVFSQFWLEMIEVAETIETEKMGQFHKVQAKNT